MFTYKKRDEEIPVSSLFYLSFNYLKIDIYFQSPS